MLDSVFVEKLSVSAKIGCSAEERAYPQPLKISLNVACSLKEIKELSDSVCYDKLRKLVIDLASSQEWTLVEHLAEAIASQVLEKFKSATDTKVQINKFIFPDCESTGVIVNRSRIV